MTQRKWWSLAGGSLLIAALGWWILDVALLPPSDRSTASGYGQFLLAAVGLPISLIGLWRTLSTSQRPNLDELTDLLARSMRSQSEATAVERRLVQPAPLPIRWRRAVEGVAGPVSAALTANDGQGWFDPLPGLTRTTAAKLRTGTRRTLHSVYGGLPSGRLMIIGAPGAGKSSTAVLLMLDALRYRDQVALDVDRRRIPVPVMFTLQGWNPRTTGVLDWLTAKLTELPLFRTRDGIGQARSLLEASRIAVFLDGLDEIAVQLRPLALRALSEQATFRLVVLTRSLELTEAAKQHGLHGAVALELQPLPPDIVADYLLRPLTEPAPTSWQNIAATVINKPDSPLTQSLANPLWVSLVHDIYHPTGPVEELLDETLFSTPEDIQEHLLDGAVTAAYTSRPGQPTPTYSQAATQRTLTYIAQQLNRKGSRDLTWWNIATWIPTSIRVTISTLMGAALFALIFAAVLTIFSGITGNLTGTLLDVAITGLAIGAPFGAVFGFGLGSIGTSPPARASLSIKQIFSPTLATNRVMAGIGFGLAIHLTSGPTKGAITAVVTTLLAAVLIQPADGSVEPEGPVQTWRRDRMIWLIVWFPIGLTLGIMLGAPEGLFFGIALGISLGLMGLQTWHCTTTQVYLAVRHRTPLRLVRFLEDARKRHLLRTVGPVYQFRHATLQDRLARKN